MAERDPHDYTLEVCKACGAQLDRYRSGRCPVSEAHHRYGGMVVRVVARPDVEQDHISFRRGVVPPTDADERLARRLDLLSGSLAAARSALADVATQVARLTRAPDDQDAP